MGESVQGIQGTTGTSIQGTTGTSIQGTTGSTGGTGLQGFQGTTGSTGGTGGMFAAKCAIFSHVSEISFQYMCQQKHPTLLVLSSYCHLYS